MTFNAIKAASAIALAVMSFSASANNYQEISKDLVDREREIRSNAGEIVGDLNLRPEVSDEALSLAREVISDSRKAYAESTESVRDAFDVEVPKEIRRVDPEKEWVNILISRSLGESDIEQIMRSVEGFEVPVRFVFQGIPEGATINDAMRDFALWSRELPSTPEAVINPTVFTENNVTNVPRMMWMDSGEIVASVDGITNPRWLKDQIDAGEQGYLGVRGPVQDISERNLIEVMKEKMLEVDLMAKKQESIDTYFERTNFIYLEQAKEDKTRYIDPTVIVQKPIRGKGGEVAIPAGATFNPLAMRPFTLRLVIFNPNEPEELEWLKDLPDSKNRKDIYIASELQGSKGWDQLQSVQDMIDDNVFLLKNDVWQRFDIEKTPSIVTSEGLMFRIDEYAMKESASESSIKGNSEE